jgi:hypothetical protein
MFWPRTTTLETVAIFFALVSCASVPGHGQNSSSDFSKKVRIVPGPVVPAPFATSRVHRNTVYSVRFENADQLTPQDRLLVANAESAISELATSARLGYRDSQWNYRQIVCPSFTDHLFLQFRRDNGRGDVSIFSASIPRNGIGKIRIIPILKRSYSLFSPAPINALTISAFNHIRAEEGESANDDWLGNALCYAALAGAQPQILSGDSWPSPRIAVPPLTAALDVRLFGKGEEVISFDDLPDHTHSMEWTMTFTSEGKLIKATHKPGGMLRAQPVPETSAVMRKRPAS